MKWSAPLVSRSRWSDIGMAACLRRSSKGPLCLAGGSAATAGADAADPLLIALPLASGLGTWGWLVLIDLG
ncbi:hypothetical protein GCM10023346_19430 [Arthrobacter gyeryongensis]|uniref:Uncharacterized protein n=1 Tax=Arthrobacter gyeryongensis TaxID=1650592 RepID=A0ABP9SDA8_9MICC